ncbi:MAG: hypothetical protein LCH53_02300 [Bacteroidetes bacterium]|nr:hypothetical protein [Bacteroidota bacterium]
MGTVEEIEVAVERLTPEDLSVFRAWFAAFDAQRWDRQMEEDIGAGRLDFLADEALREAKHGRATDL